MAKCFQGNDVRGKARTPKFDSADLATIFYKIRACRPGDTNTRRSLMRRARLALAQTALSEAERHEVLCVWSRREVSQIDSPALRKLLGHVSARDGFDGQLAARQFTRKQFKPKRQLVDASNDPMFTRAFDTPPGWVQLRIAF